jgi:Xaa-Pro aminopeptidase
MRAGVLVFATLLACTVLPCLQAQAINQHEYQARRQEVCKDLKGVLAAFGRTSEEGEQLRSGFFQEPYFYYLTGWTEPDALLLLTKDEEEIFLPARDEHYERYYGHRTSAGDPDAQERSGFQRVLKSGGFERELFRLLGGGNTVNVIRAEPQSKSMAQLLAFRPGTSIEDATKRLNTLRSIKSSEEIGLLRKSAEISVEAQAAAYQAVAPGKYEYQIAATLEESWTNRGCERPAYAPIVASGLNSVVLHYSAGKGKMEAGDVLVMDAAAECSYYAADITRTLPVNGHFTARQREIYNVVLSAQLAAIEAVKPGAVIGRKETKASLMQIAYNYMNTHGKDLHGEPLGKYVLHGLSHHVGLDVHDPGDIMQPLKPGMVITIEPGIYVRDEKIGVRIEDMVLVTDTGHEVLTAALPKQSSDIERLMKHSKNPQ